MNEHRFPTCRDDHEPTESDCRMAMLELLDRTSVRALADFAEDLGVIERRELRVIDGGKS